MSETTILEKAQEIKNKLERMYDGNKVVPYAREGLSLLGNQPSGEEGYELKKYFYYVICKMYVMTEAAEEVFPYLLPYRQLVHTEGSEKDKQEFHEIVIAFLPWLAEINAISNQEIRSLIEEAKPFLKDDEDDATWVDISLIQTYRKRGWTAKADELIAKHQHWSPPEPEIYDEDGEYHCPSCQRVNNTHKLVELGRIQDARKQMEMLMESSQYRCGRAPRVGAAALVDHYLRKNDLKAAQPYADMLEEDIDYGWKAGVYMGNTLFEYLVRTGRFEEALYWLNRYGQDMQTSQMSHQRRRFWSTALKMLDGLLEMEEPYLKGLELEVGVVSEEDGYSVKELRNEMLRWV
jgi:hypothetical protein